MSRTLNAFTPPLWILTLIAFGVGAWLLYELKEIVSLLVVGFSIAYVIEPLLRYGERNEVSRPVSLLTICTLLVLFFLTVGMTVLPTISREFRTLQDNLPDFMSRAQEVVLPFAERLLPGDPTSAEGARGLLDELPGGASSFFQKVLKGVGAALMQGYSLTLTIVNLFLLPFIVYYLSLDFPKLRPRVLSLFPYLQQARVQSLLSRIDGYVSAYVRGQLTVGGILFSLYALGLGMIGVELWLVLALISGFGNLVPYLGFLVGIVLSTTMALVTFGDFSHVLAVWAVFAAVQGLEGSFITPKIVGESIGLPPLVVLLSLVAGGTLFGLLGIFLAIPTVASIRVLGGALYEWAREASRRGAAC